MKSSSVGPSGSAKPALVNIRVGADTAQSTMQTVGRRVQSSVTKHGISRALMWTELYALVSSEPTRDPESECDGAVSDYSCVTVPVIGVSNPDLTAKRPDPPAKFPVISAANSHSKPLISRIQLDYFGQFQAQKPQKYPVLETRSLQTASTANKINKLR